MAPPAANSGKGEAARTKSTRANTPAPSVSTPEKPLTIDEALEILWKRDLIPQAARASTATLVTGLQHLAASCKSATDRMCILAFATYAEKIDAGITAREVSKAVEKHLEMVEDRIKEAAKKLSDVTRNIGQSTTKMTDDMVEAAEIMKGTAVKIQDQATKPSETPQVNSYAHAVANGGTQPIPYSHATTLARAQTRARQFIIDGMTKPQPGDNTLTEEVLVEKGNMTLKLMKAPEDIRCKGVRWLENGGLVYEMTTEKGASWVSAVEHRAEFIEHFGGEPDMKITGHSYQVLVDFTPVQFEPNNEAAIEHVETYNNMEQGAILEARWIKPVNYRGQNQRTALLALHMKSAEEANKTLKNGLTICGKLLRPRKNTVEPRRCLKCQQVGVRHVAATCRATHDTCATCGKTDHRTNQCMVKDPAQRYCKNCGVSGHGAWERTCSYFMKKKAELNSRIPDSQYRYFPTADDPTTWETVHGGHNETEERQHNAYRSGPNAIPNAEGRGYQQDDGWRMVGDRGHAYSQEHEDREQTRRVSTSHPRHFTQTTLQWQNTNSGEGPSRSPQDSRPSATSV